MLQRRCSKCKELKSLNHDYYENRGGHLTVCKKCLGKRSPRSRLWHTSRSDANRNGLDHTIRERDIVIPETCKYLGVKLDYPALDRVNPKLGYVVGNIQVISELAKRMKSDASIEELVRFARGVLFVHSHGCDSVVSTT